jgi:YegS/Rv2252/BmrU family lipid kinase
MSSSVIIIANPSARAASRRKVEKAAGIITARGFDARVLYTSKRGDAVEFARDAAKKEPRLIIAAGGDGTYNEVANGLAETTVPMAVLPIGMVNVLAREVGIPLDVKNAVDAALNRTPRNVSLGKITFGGEQRYFLLMAGIGFDARTVATVNLQLKRVLGKAAYVLNGFKTLVSWNPNELTISTDKAGLYGYALIACNASKYAGELCVAPDADMADPHLGLFVMHGGGKADILKYVLGIITKRHLKLKDVTYIKAETIKVDGVSDIQIDGDFVGKSPASITVVPDALRLVY